MIVSRVYSHVERAAYYAVSRLDPVNGMLRKVYVNDILPKKAKRNRPRGYRSEAAMTTTTAAKRSGKKRDIIEVVWHNRKVTGHYANKCPAKKTLPGDTTTNWCSLHKLRSHSDIGCMAQQVTPQSAPPVYALPATISHAAQTCSYTFSLWQANRFCPLRKAGYIYWSTSAVHLIWSIPR